ncbi:ribonuclease HI family protein [Chloroflexota bacterium]
MANIITSIIKIYVDGACSGNPGPGSIGIVILDENNNEITTCKECVGDTTNNRAEYRALMRGLEIGAGICRRKAICYSDSELVVKQLNGLNRIKKPELLLLFMEVKKRSQLFEEVIYQHMVRTNQYITKADRLAQEALSDT